MRVRFDYYKVGGKWKYEGEIDWPGIEDLHFFEAVEKAGRLIDSGQPLPGIVGTWKGPIMLTELKPVLGSSFEHGLTHVFIEHVPLQEVIALQMREAIDDRVESMVERSSLRKPFGV